MFENAINVHASLLPKYRGGSPIQYAIKNGDAKTGISLMKMVKKMDAGEVYAQEEIAIAPSDDAGSLFEKLGKLGQSMLAKYLLAIFQKTIVGTPQDETKVSFAYNLTNDQEVINWEQDSTSVVNFIRCLSPKPVAYTYLFEERIKIKQARVVSSDEKVSALNITSSPGMIINVDKEGITVKVKDGYIKILELQRAGKSMTSAGSFDFPNSPFRITWMFCEKPYKKV
nr:methionyl-tRNA formyltransferase [Spiroplasma clarkii]